jgi:hypothetical protein
MSASLQKLQFPKWRDGPGTDSCIAAKSILFRSIRRRGRAAIQFGGPTSVRFFKIADVLAWECACKSSAVQRSIIIAAAITASISATIIAMWRGLLIMCRIKPNRVPSGSRSMPHLRHLPDSA